MFHPLTQPLRVLTEEDRTELVRVKRASGEAVCRHRRAVALLAVSEGRSLIDAAKSAGWRDLVAKFSTYAHYATLREWYKEPGGLPLLLVVAPAKVQEMRIARIASVLLRDTPALAIATTTATRLVEQGPIAAIWYQVPITHQQTDMVPRSRLYGASSHW